MRQKLAASASPTGATTIGAFAFAFAFAFAVDLDLRGPSAAAEPADKTQRAPHMDVRRFSQGQDA
ncbi:hypothetical protein ACFONC_13320, partial [Luteimonas soli]